MAQINSIASSVGKFVPTTDIGGHGKYLKLKLQGSHSLRLACRRRAWPASPMQDTTVGDGHTDVVGGRMPRATEVQALEDDVRGAIAVRRPGLVAHVAIARRDSHFSDSAGQAMCSRFTDELAKGNTCAFTQKREKAVSYSSSFRRLCLIWQPSTI